MKTGIASTTSMFLFSDKMPCKSKEEWITKEDSEIEISETVIESTKTSILSITDNKVQSVIEEKVQIRDKDQTFEEFHDPQMNFKTTVRIKM